MGTIDSVYADERCGIPSLDTSTGCSDYGFTRLNGDAGSNESNYGLTTGSGQWATEFSYGTVWGIANCNTTAGVSQGDINNNLQTESGGTYCWCQATGFTASGNAYTSGPQCTTTASSYWVFNTSTSVCARGCALQCASGVQSSASFRRAVFGVAGYIPQTVELTWYDGDTQMSGGPSSCVVGGTFLPPTPPARTGYDFAGWKIKPRTCGIPSLNTGTNGRGTSYLGYAKLSDSTGVRESDYGLTRGSGQWAVEFNYGTVWGIVRCSSTSGNTSNDTWPSSSQSNWLKEVPNDNGRYCWCQATGFTASGNAYTSGPQCTTTTSSLWVYSYVYGSYTDCANMCGNACTYFVRPKAAFRVALFGAVGQ